jgi:hypothetical protein
MTANPWVRITNKPISCCGVIQQGWEGQIAYVLATSDELGDDIVVLTDRTLVWKKHCEEINKPSVN